MNNSFSLGSKKFQIISPDFLSMPKKHVKPENFIDEGIFLDYAGKPVTLDTPKWFGVTIERTYEFVGGNKVPKPAHRVDAFFGDMHIATKNFTETDKTVIAEGDLLTIKDGKLVKKTQDTEVVAFQCVSRGTDYIEAISVACN